MDDHHQQCGVGTSQKLKRKSPTRLGTAKNRNKFPTNSDIFVILEAWKCFQQCCKFSHDHRYTSGGTSDIVSGRLHCLPPSKKAEQQVDWFVPTCGMWWGQRDWILFLEPLLAKHNWKQNVKKLNFFFIQMENAHPLCTAASQLIAVKWPEHTILDESTIFKYHSCQRFDTNEYHTKFRHLIILFVENVKILKKLKN